MKQSRSVSLGRTGTTTELSSRDTQPTTNTLESTVETPSRHAHHLQPRKIVPTSTEELLVYKRIKRGLTRPSIDDETLESPSDWGTPLQLQMQKSQQQRRKASRSTYSRGREQRSMPKEGRSRPSNNLARKTAPRAPVSAKTPQTPTPIASPSHKERESKVEESAKNKSESSAVRTSKTLSSHSRSGAGVANTPRAITPMELSAAIRKEGALAHEKDKLLSAEKIKQSMRNRQLKKDENKKNEELKNPNPSTYIPSDNKERKENDGDKRLTKEVFVHEKAPPFSPMKIISEEEGTSPPGEEPKKSKPDESLGKKDQHKAKGEDPKDERGQQLDKKDSKAGERNDKKERECKEQESGKKRDANGESKAVDRNNRKERECREQESGKKKDVVKGESKAGEQRHDRKERECREQESGKKKDFKIESKAGDRNDRKERECREQESGKKKDFKFEIKAAERNDKREGKEQESGKKKEKEDTDQKKKKEKAPKDVEEQKNTKNDKENVKNEKEPPDSDIN